MRPMMKLTATSALVLSLSTSSLLAQNTEDTGSDAQSTDAQAQADATADTTTGETSANDTGGSQTGEDVLVVTVGDTDVMGSDVSEAISLLPPQMRQQPPAMLVPMAINQLIARELILREAMAESLDEDPEVIALVSDAQAAQEQDAMVQVWLQRALDERVTDEEVQAEYDEIKANTDRDIPPLEDVRAQIEQQLRQEAFAGLQENLREDVEITYYGPDGKPREVSSETVGQDEN